MLRLSVFWLGLAAALPCSANTFVFWTTDVATVGSTADPVAARVSITTNANGSVDILLSNLETNIYKIDQAVSSIDLLLHGVSGTPTSVTMKTDSGVPGSFSSATTFDANLTANSSALTLATIANPWSIATSSQLSGGTSLGALHTTATSAKDLIIGPGPYNVDGSGSGTMRNSQNNEYLQTTLGNHIGWTLQYANGVVDQNTNVDAVRLTFGLTYTSTYELALTETPEPGSFVLMLGGFALLGFGGKNFRRILN